MFDSDNIPLVTRIEAGFGVAVSYSTNSDSEAVYRVTVDSEQIVQLIARVINAGTSGVRNDADSDLVSSVTNVFTAGEGIEITEIPASGGAGTITVNVSAVDANEATITFSDEDDAIAFAALDTITGGGPDTQVIALGSNNFGASASTLVSDVVEVLWSRGGDLATGNSLLNISTAAAPLSVSRSGSVVTLTLDSSVAAHTSQSGTGWVERSNVVFTTETSDNLGYTFFDTPGNYYSVDSGVSSTIASTPVVEASTQIAATNSGGFDSDQVVAIIAANASSSVQPVQVVRWQLDLDAGTIIVDLDSDIQGYLSGGLDVTSVTYGFNNQSPGSAAIDPDSDAASTYTLTNSTASAFAFRYTITLSTKDLNEIKRLGANIASSYLRVNTEALTLQGNYYFRGNSADEMHWQGRPFVYSQDITAPQINLAAYKTGDSDGGARLTLTFSEIVDVSTFDVGHITLGDDIVQTNSRVLSSGSNLQTTVDSDTVIIEIADSDRAAIAPLITGGIANELYMALTSATVTDLDGNPVTPVTQFDGFPIDITQPMASMADIGGGFDSDQVVTIITENASSSVQGVTVLASELVIGTANPVITLTLDSDITGYLSGGFDVTNVSVGVTDSDIGADSEAINSYTLTNSTVRPGTSGGQRVIIDLSRKDLNEIKRLGPTSAATSYLRVGSGAFTFQGNYYFQGNSTDGMTWQANPTIFVGDSIAPGVIAGSVYSPGDSELGARLTITLDEIVDVSTFEPRAITLQDFIDFSGPPITQRQLSSGSNVLTTVDSDAVTIAISASDRTAIAPLIASGFGNNQLFFVLDNFTLVSDLSSLPYDASRQGTTTNPFEIIVDQPMASMTDIGGGFDSDQVVAIVAENVSSLVQADSDWVMSVLPGNVLDSDDVLALIPENQVDSDWVLSVSNPQVDSDFVMTTMMNSAIDSDYILNQIDSVIAGFTDSDFVIMAVKDRLDSELTNNINPRFVTIETRVGADSDRLTTVDTNVTTLTARVDSDAEIRTNLNAVTSDVTTLTSRVDSDAEIRTNLNAVTSDITTLTARVDSDAEIRTNLNAVTSDITTLTSRVDADSDRLVSVNASVTTRLVSVETQTSALDSDWVIRTANESGKVDSDYVERRVIAAQQNTVDSDYVERRVIAAQQNTVDSDWVMARLTELDSDEINTLITAKIRNVQFDSEWTVSMVRSVVKDASDSDKALIRSDIIIVQGNLDSEVARLDIAVDVATDSERFERIERVLQIGAFAPATVAAVVAASADSEYIAYSHDRTTTTDIQFRYRIVDGDVTIHSGLVQVGDGLNEVQVLRALSAVVNTDTIAKRYISRFTLVGNAIEYGFASTFADYSIAIDVESSNDGSVFTVYPVQ